MKGRRQLLKAVTSALLCPWPMLSAYARAGAPARRRRVRPGDTGWPDEEEWNSLSATVGGRLEKLKFPFSSCSGAPASADCAAAFEIFKNPLAVGDDPALAQTLGWVDAWTFKPSAYVVAAESAQDVAAAVRFASEKNLRLVVKGGGHSYQGTSSAPDSLLIWTRHMNAIEIHDEFVPMDCAGSLTPTPAVSVGAGAIWLHVYQAVTVEQGRYVQGGGCTSVGVAGLVQGGGFGSLSKQFGTAAGNLLEAEIVTADGVVRVVNAKRDPDLFWAVKGGGGGSFGVVTRLTLATHPLPAQIGAIFFSVKASSTEAFLKLITHTLSFYARSLFNPHWGEQIIFGYGGKLKISMTFQGISKADAQAIWQPFLDLLNAAPDEFTMTAPVKILEIPAQSFWDARLLGQVPGIIRKDSRPGASPADFVWAGDANQCGEFLHGYSSRWLPQTLLADSGIGTLARALLAATEHWDVELHCNKGLAGGPSKAISEALDTATNPQVTEAFALAIIAGGDGPGYPGLAGRPVDLVDARQDAKAIHRAAELLRGAAPGQGCYLSECDFFESDWHRSFWGKNYDRLAAVKAHYDPAGLFFVHHGVGSDHWSADGFTPA